MISTSAIRRSTTGVARIDRGLQPGLSTAERGEVAAAKKRIAELETELAVSRRSLELLKEDASPKGGTRPSK